MIKPLYLFLFCPFQISISDLLWYVSYQRRRYNKSIIEELYYGNITPPERSFHTTGEYAHILQLVTRNEEKLTEMLTEAQKETFEKFKDNTSELSAIIEVMAFTLGFKLSLRLTAETFIGGDSEQELISE